MRGSSARRTSRTGAGRRQTDLLAVLGVGDGLAVMGVEAKVDESFGPFVSEWLADGSEGKRARLSNLCALLGIDPADAGSLRYQLLHRTAAAILEARRYRAGLAIVMVQSFCPNATGHADYRAFFTQVGLSGLGVGELSSAKGLGGLTLRAGWAGDDCPSGK